jgi:hypothetical protein
LPDVSSFARHFRKAVYGGDGNFGARTSNIVKEEVVKN